MHDRKNIGKILLDPLMDPKPKVHVTYFHKICHLMNVIKHGHRQHLRVGTILLQKHENSVVLCCFKQNLHSANHNFSGKLQILMTVYEDNLQLITLSSLENIYHVFSRNLQPANLSTSRYPVFRTTLPRASQIS